MEVYEMMAWKKAIWVYLANFGLIGFELFALVHGLGLIYVLGAFLLLVAIDFGVAVACGIKGVSKLERILREAERD